MELHQMTPKNEAKDSIFKKKRLINIRGALREITSPWVMGILNATPDSFYEKSRAQAQGEAVERVREMLAEGADLIDIGASSTRPGAEMLPPKEEIKRLKAVLPNVRKEFPDAILSVDTYYSEVATAAADMGGDIINDISGGTFDPEMPKVMGQLKLPYILMHIKGTPATMQQTPHYENVYKEVALFLSQQMAKFLDHGVNDIILDPGFGFGKNLEHNYELLSKMDLLKTFERPILVGISRKSIVNKVINTKPENALNGTTVLHVLALQKGADILRVHDVREAREAVKILTFTQNFT